MTGRIVGRVNTTGELVAKLDAGGGSIGGFSIDARQVIDTGAWRRASRDQGSKEEQWLLDRPGGARVRLQLFDGLAEDRTSWEANLENLEEAATTRQASVRVSGGAIVALVVAAVAVVAAVISGVRS